MCKQTDILNSFKRHIAVVLLLACTFFVVPKELLHELTCHDDTVDTHCIPTDGLAISTIHHHCDIFQVFVQPYNASDASMNFSNAVRIIEHYSFNDLSFSVEVVQRFVIRGPPAAYFYC